MREKRIQITGDGLDLEMATAIAKGRSCRLSADAKKRISHCRAYVEKILMNNKAVYGVNTGFGYFANTKVGKTELKELQKNVVLSHAAGFGKPLCPEVTRLAMALRLNVIAQGHTGVRLVLAETLEAIINHGIYPLVPEYGSVGASGDLAPLAHLALPLIGEGYVIYKGKEMLARTALKKAGISPIELVEKEGLGLINGTQVMLAIGALALRKALRLAKLANLTAALSMEGLEASCEPLDLLIHRARGHSGQIRVAKEILDHLKGSKIRRKNYKSRRIQDPYSFRCVPQVHGPSVEALQYVESVLCRELSAATDNPLVFPEKEKVLSGGNFHGQALALAYNMATLAVAELGNISERRVDILFNPHFSGQAAFLSPKPGTQSGYMAAQYLAAHLVNENKALCYPSSTDSIPGNVGVEDHVSMGMTAARQLQQAVENLQTILAVESVVAKASIEMRKARRLGHGTANFLHSLQAHITPYTQDRIVARDIQASRDILNLIFP